MRARSGGCCFGTARWPARSGTAPSGVTTPAVVLATRCPRASRDSVLFSRNLKNCSYIRFTKHKDDCHEIQRRSLTRLWVRATRLEPTAPRDRFTTEVAPAAASSGPPADYPLILFVSPRKHACGTHTFPSRSLCASWTCNLLSTGRHGVGRDDGLFEIFLRRAERKSTLTSSAWNSRMFADAEEREARILSPPSVGRDMESKEVGRCSSRTRTP